MKNFLKKLWLNVTLFCKKHWLNIQLSIIFILVLTTVIASLNKVIDFPTGISIFAALIAICILLISTHEIRNRLRPWVAVNKIEEETTRNPNIFYTHFIITNTGPIPATKILYTARWYIQENDMWKEIKIKEESPFKSAQQTLFPNQRMRHRTEMHDIKTAIGDQDAKVTFTIEYRGLWSKHTTINTLKFVYTHKVWLPDEPQDYT